MIELDLLGTLDLRGAPRGRPPSFVTGSKRLALLTYLALATPRGFQRRDTLLVLLWPELDQDHARNALRNMIHLLRHSLGDGVLVGRGGEEIGLAHDVVRCDVHVFEQAVERADFAAALELYRGDLLAGFHVTGASQEFEGWLEGERARLRGQAAEAARGLVRSAEAREELREAIGWARRLAQLAPYDEEAWRTLIDLFDRTGNRATALRTYQGFAARLAEELGIVPAAETLALIDSVRSRARPRPPETSRSASGWATATAPAPAAAPTPPASDEDTGSAPMRLRRHPMRRGPALAAAAALALPAIWVLVSWPGAPAHTTDPHRIAVTFVEDRTGADAAEIAALLPELLATGLAQAPGISVVPPARFRLLLEATVGERDPLEARVARAARAANASELIEGALHSVAGGRLGLALRRVDARTGAVMDAVTVEGTTPFELADGAVVELLARLGIDAPLRRIAEVTTPSLMAFRFFEEGLRAFYAGDRLPARDHFQAALREDSTFALAAYYLAEASRGSAADATPLELHRRAHQLAHRASDYERLIITASWLVRTNDPALLPVAETLAVRYPAAAEGSYYLGRALLLAGDFGDAIPQLERAIALDSLSLHTGSARCVACDAFRALTEAHSRLDAMDRAEATARRSAGLQPGSATARQQLAYVLGWAGNYDEALSVWRESLALRTPSNEDLIFPANIEIRRENYAAADAILRELIDRGAPDLKAEALFFQTISYRHQGRSRAALEAAAEYMRVREAQGMPPPTPTMQAQVLLEMGRAAEAAELFKTAYSMIPPEFTASQQARDRVWRLTHLATALAAAGDATALDALPDSIQRMAQASIYGRDRRLHHYVRGLLLAARGAPWEEVAHEQRHALYAVVLGYSRINLELGRALLEAGRTDEAIAVLTPALRNTVQSNGFYITRSELHALVGQAWEAAARPDSAAVHYRAVLEAWQNADPEFVLRREAIRARLAGLAQKRG